jgi:hypothetical protein
MMLALQIEGYSNRPAAQLGDIPIAAPRAGEVRVRVGAAALNPLAAVLVGSSPCKTLREFPQHDKRGKPKKQNDLSGDCPPRRSGRAACVLWVKLRNIHHEEISSAPTAPNEVAPRSALAWHQSLGPGCDPA